MSFETMHQFRDPGASHSLFAELSLVAVVCAVQTDDGHAIPAGTEGTVVAVYGNGAAYEVEFDAPTAGTATVPADGLRAV